MRKLYRQEYVGMTSDGEILCEGNLNTNLDYHLASFKAFVSGKHPIPLVLNKKTMSVICKEWNRQFRGASKCHCKPYRVRFSLEVIESQSEAESCSLMCMHKLEEENKCLRSLVKKLADSLEPFSEIYCMRCYKYVEGKCTATKSDKCFSIDRKKLIAKAREVVK